MPVCQCTGCENHDGKCGKTFHDADGNKCGGCRSSHHSRNTSEGMGGIGGF